MKVTFVFVLLATVFLAVVSAFPSLDDSVKKYEIEFPVIEPDEIEEQETGVRFQRATCDLLSISTPIGSLNHAACAAHCLAMRKGFRGGRCRDGVCHCRR